MYTYKSRGQFKKDLERDDELGQVCKWFVDVCGISMYLKNRVLEVYNSLHEDERLNFMTNLKKDLLSQPSDMFDSTIIERCYSANFGYSNRMPIMR